MSTQRGNALKTGAPKHKNKTAFNNTMHDRSKRNLALVSMQITGCCQRCKDIIDWKIKYKKYKPLSQPKTCTRCKEKTIKKAYFVMCQKCSRENHICAKCGEKKDTVENVDEGNIDVDKYKRELLKESKHLSERERRTYIRQMMSKLDLGKDNEELSNEEDVEDDKQDVEDDKQEQNNYHCEEACRKEVLHNNDTDSD